MEFREIRENKKQLLPLLLLADEQESMIDRYLDRGSLYVLEDPELRCECVVTDEGSGILEVKSLATLPSFQNRGYGRAMLDFIARRYRGEYSILQVGTGESPSTLPFYERCGFVYSHRVKDFFLENYDHPIFEGGVRLRDMVYLRKRI